MRPTHNGRTRERLSPAVSATILEAVQKTVPDPSPGSCTSPARSSAMRFGDLRTAGMSFVQHRDPTLRVRKSLISSHTIRQPVEEHFEPIQTLRLPRSTLLHYCFPPRMRDPPSNSIIALQALFEQKRGDGPLRRFAPRIGIEIRR